MKVCLQNGAVVNKAYILKILLKKKYAKITLSSFLAEKTRSSELTQIKYPNISNIQWHFQDFFKGDRGGGR